MDPFQGNSQPSEAQRQWQQLATIWHFHVAAKSQESPHPVFNNHSVGSRMQQALEYAATLDIPFVFSTNGDALLLHDRLAKDGEVEQEYPLDEFPSPDELWQRLCERKNLSQAKTQIVN